MDSGTLFQQAVTKELLKKITSNNKMKNDTISFYAGLEAFKTGQNRGIDKLNEFYTQYNLVMMELNNKKFDIEIKINKLGELITTNKLTLSNSKDEKLKDEISEKIKEISNNKKIEIGVINWNDIENLQDNLLTSQVLLKNNDGKILNENQFILEYLINNIDEQVINTVSSNNRKK